MKSLNLQYRKHDMYFTNKENVPYIQDNNTKRASKPSETRPNYMNKVTGFHNKETKERYYNNSKNSHKEPVSQEERENPMNGAYDKIQLLMDKLHQKISLRVIYSI